ncbi:MAG TPA: bifunctional precorrin-2 dehydrogenase/sirohydrochlorin ferrochelatase [Acidimicrobiales bacterium]|nr:bifunctional precorrin-2 dehydrogenase/sirohydrochlorin ferrochelatase [Acidimicrobiales bacterium]
MLAGKSCLVVGGGPVAARKIRSLVHCGALVTVVAPQISADIEKMEGIRIELRSYDPGEARNYRLVFAATSQRELNHLIYQDAESAGIFANTADDPQACSFMLPSVIRQDPVTVAVSTSGASPALAVWLRNILAGFVGQEHAAMAELLSQARQELHTQGRSSESVNWSELLEGDLPSLVRSGRIEDARKLVEKVSDVELAERAGVLNCSPL